MTPAQQAHLMESARPIARAQRQRKPRGHEQNGQLAHCVRVIIAEVPADAYSGATTTTGAWLIDGRLTLQPMRNPIPLSVIVPTRDTCDLTLRCLAAVDASDVAPAQVVLVDDGSTDLTAEAVTAAWPRVEVLRQSQPRGFTAAINEAWPLARAEVVLLLNSDTEVARDALRRYSAAFEREPRLGIAGASLHHPDGGAQWSAGREPDAAWLFALASGAVAALGKLPGWRRVRRESQTHGDADWVPATAMAVRDEVRREIGLFDPALATYAQDLDYCVRARRAGWRVAQLTDVHVMHWLGATLRRHDTAVAEGFDPAALVGDLARWIRRRHGPARARRLCLALRAGLHVRLAARALAAPWPFLPDPARWNRDTTRYRAALAAINGPDDVRSG
jgi:N-acetylglucosaminyl-diphospho-decaprenol L-rhamnosyltransferase